MSRCRWSVSRGTGLKVCEEQLDDKVSGPTARKTNGWGSSSQEVTECFRASFESVRRLEARIPQAWHRSVKKRTTGQCRLKEHVGWWEAEINENERRDFPPGPEKECDRYRTEQRAAVEEDPESSVTEALWKKEGQAC